MNLHLTTFRALLLASFLLLAQWANAEHIAESIAEQHQHDADCVVCVFEKSSGVALSTDASSLSVLNADLRFPQFVVECCTSQRSAAAIRAPPKASHLSH